MSAAEQVEALVRDLRSVANACAIAWTDRHLSPATVFDAAHWSTVRGEKFSRHLAALGRLGLLRREGDLITAFDADRAIRLGSPRPGEETWAKLIGDAS